ncbi:MAG: hypothetical protein ACK5KT_11700 [Dysgonomonas sp.]
MNSKRNYPLWIFLIIVLSLIAVIITLLAENEIPSMASSGSIIAIISTFIGILITMSVTSLLLSKQSEMEGLKDQNVKQFEKKQEVYHAFIDKLNRIVEDIVEKNLSGNDIRARDNINKLETLIFQLGYLNIHSDKETIISTVDSLSEIMVVISQLQQGNSFQPNNPEVYSRENDNNNLHAFATRLTAQLFNICTLLRRDLYNQAHDEEGLSLHLEQRMANLFRKCGLKPTENL